MYRVIIASFVLAVSACSTDDAQSGIVVVTFNTGTTPGLGHDSGPDDGYTMEDAEISDEWYGDGLAWTPSVQAARAFLAETDPDIAVFQEIFYSPECADIPPEAHDGFVCADWAPGDPTVVQTISTPIRGAWALPTRAPCCGTTLSATTSPFTSSPTSVKTPNRPIQGFSTSITWSLTV